MIIYVRVSPHVQANTHFRCGFHFVSAWQPIDVDTATRKAIKDDPRLEMSDSDPGGPYVPPIDEDVPLKARLFSALTNRPAADVFGPGQCQITTNTYKVISISSGGAWFSYGSSDLLADRPTALALGAGFWYAKDTQSTYTSDGANWFELVHADANGDIFANIVPRTNTLSGLMATIGAQGELASATDVEAIIQYPGLTAGGKVFPSADEITKNNVPGALNIAYCLSGAVIDGIAPMLIKAAKSRCSPPYFLAYLSTATNKVFFSMNGRHWMLANPLPSSTTWNVEGVDGGFFAIPTVATTTLHYSACGPGGTLAATNTLPSAAAPFSTTYNLSTVGFVAIVIPTGSNNFLSYALANSPTIKYTLPVTAIWTKFVGHIIKDPLLGFTTNISVGLTVAKGAVNVVRFKQNAPSVFTSLPVALAAPVVSITDNWVIVSDIVARKAFRLPISELLAVPVTLAWEDISSYLPGAVDLPMLCNSTHFVTASGGNKLWYSTDGILWRYHSGVITQIDVFDNVVNMGGSNTLLSLVTGKTITSMSGGVSGSGEGGVGCIGNTIVDSAGVCANLAGVIPSRVLDSTTILSAATGTVNVAQGMNIQTVGATSITYQLPDYPEDGCEVNIVFAATVTTVAFAASVAPSGQTIVGAPTTGTTTAPIRLRYEVTTNKWYRA